MNNTSTTLSTQAGVSRADDADVGKTGQLGAHTFRLAKADEKRAELTSGASTPDHKPAVQDGPTLAGEVAIQGADRRAELERQLQQGPVDMPALSSQAAATSPTLQDRASAFRQAQETALADRSTFAASEDRSGVGKLVHSLAGGSAAQALGSMVRGDGDSGTRHALGSAISSWGAITGAWGQKADGLVDAGAKALARMSKGAEKPAADAGALQQDELSLRESEEASSAERGEVESAETAEVQASESAEVQSTEKSDEVDLPSTPTASISLGIGSGSLGIGSGSLGIGSGSLGIGSAMVQSEASSLRDSSTDEDGSRDR